MKYDPAVADEDQLPFFLGSTEADQGHPTRRIRSTTVEIVVDEAFWDPVGHENYKKVMSVNRHSAE